MDWDGIGTFGLFLGSGAIGLGLIWLRAYKAHLQADLENARLHATDGDSLEVVRDELQAALDQQAAEIAELHERLDFAERLLTKGREADARAE